MNHEMSHDRISEKDIPAIEADVVKAAAEVVTMARGLTRFGLVQPLKEDDRPTEEYWKWYRWWNNYVESLSGDEFGKLDKALSDNGDVSCWRPKESWKD
jgi:hypothetical protein